MAVDLQAKKTAVATLSVVSNTLLVVGKVTIGLLIGSVSVVSEAIHSGIDLIAAAIAVCAVRRAARPADAGHHFGHGKLENLSGTIEALLIFAAAGWILWEAVGKLRHPAPLAEVGWGVGVMAVSAVLNWIVSGLRFRVGTEADSVALQADGWHLRTDVYTSAGVMVGLAAIWMGGKFFPGVDLAWLDPVAAILVAILILVTACRLTAQSARDLLDASLPAAEQGWLTDYLAGLGDEVQGHHKVRTRKAGSTRFFEFHLQVAPQMTVRRSHALAHEVADGITARFPGSSVTVHIEPSDEGD